MSVTAEKTIMISGRWDYNLDKRVVAAANTIYPGHVVDFSSGEAILNATQADTTPNRAVAVENEMVGEDIDTPYAAADTCYFAWPKRGAVSYMWLENGQNVALDALLETGATGSLQAVTTGVAIAQAMEAVNNSGGGSGPASAARIKVRWL